MAYVVPQVLVFQEFTAVPNEITDPLRAWIAGPHAELHRYSDATEKAAVALGAYDKDFDTVYSWPGRTAGSKVDASYVKLFVDDAILEYCNLPAATAGITPLKAVSGHNNRIRGEAVFADNGTAYARDVKEESGGVIVKRNVAVGDIVDIDDGTNSLSTYVRGFVGEVIAAAIGVATSDAANSASQAASAASVNDDDVVGYGGTMTAAGTYDGLADGDISEVYTITVIDPSTGQDYTTARVNVISTSGNDNALNVTPAAATVAWDVGSRGVEATIGTHASDLAVGDKFVISVSQLFEKGFPVSGGSYTGAADTTYIVECVEGGVFDSSATAPKIRVTTTDGSDSSGPSVVQNDVTDVAIGTKGATINLEGTDVEVTLTAINDGGASGCLIKVSDSPDGLTGFNDGDVVRIVGTGMAGVPDGDYVLDDKVTSGDPDVARIRTVAGNAADPQEDIDVTGQTFTGPATMHKHSDEVLHLNKGDKWYVPATAAKAGNYQTLILGHNLSTALQAASDLSIKISIKKDIEVGVNREGSAGVYNWSTSATQFTANSGILARDAGYDADTDLEVTAGSLFVQYREWLVVLSTSVYSIRDVANLGDIAGPLHPDNPLKWGVAKALSNSNGTEVKYSSVVDPDDLDEWTDTLALVVGRDDIYGLVPLTRTKTVLDLFASHVNSQSSATSGRWRTAWFNLEGAAEIAVVNAANSSDTEPVTALLSDDPSAAGTQYTRLVVQSDNVDFVTAGVAAGDIVRYIFVDDGFGNEEYTEFVVDSVTNATELILFSGHSAAITEPADEGLKVEIWHNRNKNEVATAVATAGGAHSNRRVRAVWPDVVDGNPGYFLCAALAGYVSGVSPHQGLTNAGITGFSDLSRSVDFFNASHLDTLADSGVWIVTQDRDGNILTRHALTTDNTDLNTSEEVVVRNVDSMSYLFLRRLDQFIGKANVTPSALNLMRVQTVSAIEFLKSNGFIERLGSQLIDGDILELAVHPLLKDRVIITLTLTIPYPANNIEVHLTV